MTVSVSASPGDTVVPDPVARERPPAPGIMATLSQYGVMQIVLAATALIRNKIVALRLGPAAFGEVSQIGAVAAVLATLVSFGMSVSLSRNVAKAQTHEERATHLANAIGIVLTTSALALLVCLTMLVNGGLLRWAGVAGGREATIAAALFIAGVPFMGLQTTYMAFLQGLLDIKGLALQRSSAVLVATVALAPIVWIFGFIGAALQFFVLNLFVAVLLGLRCRAIGYSPLAVRLERDNVVLLASFGLVSVASGFAQGVSDTAVRTRLIETSGAAANGLLQAPYMLAMTVKTIVLASIGTVSLATVAGAADQKEVSVSVGRLLDVVVPIGAIALGLLGLLGGPALVIVYSRAFTEGAMFFPWLLAADMLLVFQWVIGAPLLAAGDRMLWLGLSLLYAFARWGFAVLLLPVLGPSGVVVGVFLADLLQVGLSLAVFFGRYHLDMAPMHLWRVVVAVPVVMFLAFAGARAGGSVPILVAAAAVWLVYTAYHVRRTDVLGGLWRRVRG